MEEPATLFVPMPSSTAGGIRPDSPGPLLPSSPRKSTSLRDVSTWRDLPSSYSGYTDWVPIRIFPKFYPVESESTIDVPSSAENPYPQGLSNVVDLGLSSRPNTTDSTAMYPEMTTSSQGSDSNLPSVESQPSPTIKTPLKPKGKKRGRKKSKLLIKTPHRKVHRANRGCWTCKCRRKSCDRNKPGCSTCAHLCIPCLGYEDDKPETMATPELTEAQRKEFAELVRVNKERGLI